MVRLRFLVVAASCFLAREAAAVPVTKTYDFSGITSPSITHTAWSDSTSVWTSTTLAPAGETQLTTAQYSAIAADDTQNVLASSNKLKHFRFKFAVAESVASITGLRGFWIGSDSDMKQHDFYLWNFTTATWELRATSTSQTDVQLDTGAISSGFASYVSGGGLYLAVVGIDGNPQSQLRTDHVRLVVDYNAPGVAPNAPSALQQYQSDGTTVIAVGGSSTTNTVVLKGTVTDADGDMVRLVVEVKPVGTAFTGVATRTSTAVTSGSVAQVSVPSGANDYHWQAWAIDALDAVGPTTSFGANAETATDFRIPAGAGATYYVSTTGVDTPCAITRENNPSSPFLTLTAAFNCLKANHANSITGLGNHTIQIQDSGTYNELLTLAGLTNSPSDKLIIRSAPALVTKPTINGGGTRKVGILVNTDNTVIDGIRFTNFGGGNYSAGISIDGGNDVEVKNNYIFATGDFAMSVGWDSVAGGGAATSRTWIHNNVFWDIRATGTDTGNRGDCIHIMSGSQSWTIENNTFHACAQAAIHTMTDAAAESNGTIRGNVITSTVAACEMLKIGTTAGGQTGLVSDRNVLFQVGGAGDVGRWGAGAQATLAAWQTASSRDTNSLEVDPLYANATAGDFHEQSNAGYLNAGVWTNAPGITCSRAIDYADPSLGWGLEPGPSGYRRNLGAFGNTAEASKSCACTEPLSDGTDNNNTRAAARVCPLVRGSMISGAQASGTDTSDFFFFNASPATSYKFDVTITSAAQFDLFLYDATGALITSDAPGAGGTTGPGATRSVTATLASALYYLEVRYISGTSTYTLGASFASPLSSDVNGFEVRDEGGFVRARWETGPESDAVGFRLVRDGAGETRVVGADPIPATQHVDGGYVQDDLDVVCGERYEYLLEELRPEGSTEYVGPASITPCANRSDPAGCAVAPGRSSLGALALLALALLARRRA